MKRPIAALTACFVSLACVANEVRYFDEGQIPSPAEVASLLAAPTRLTSAPSGLGGRTRGVRISDSGEDPHRVQAPMAVRAAASPDGAAVRPEPNERVRLARLPSVGSVALALRFDADASRMQAQHMSQLDALAEGIKQLPDSALITISGHTDAYGAALYNLDLSLKRAMAVRAYLIRVHGIPGHRLVATGKGKSEPLNRANPYAPENRRVQVHAEYDLA